MHHVALLCIPVIAYVVHLGIHVMERVMDFVRDKSRRARTTRPAVRGKSTKGLSVATAWREKSYRTSFMPWDCVAFVAYAVGLALLTSRAEYPGVRELKIPFVCNYCSLAPRGIITSSHCLVFIYGA